MKRVQVYLILIGMFLVSSCCKTYCTDEMLLVSFQKFQRQYVDTTYYIAYQKGTGFAQVTDSIADIIPVVPGDTSHSTEIKILDTEKDWIVKIPSLNKSYQFTNYSFSNERCNCGNNKYKKIDSFSVNGVVSSNSFIVLE